MVDNIKSGTEIKKKGGTEFCVFCFSNPEVIQFETYDGLDAKDGSLRNVLRFVH